jgi:hypothetical protein
VTTPRASAFLKLSRQLIDLSGPFSGLETLPHWRFIDLLQRHYPRGEVLDAAEETLAQRIDGPDRPPLAGGPLMVKLRQPFLKGGNLHEEYRAFQRSVEGILPQPYDRREDRPTMRAALKSFSKLLEGFEGKWGRQAICYWIKDDPKTRRYLLRFSTNEIMRGDLGIYWHICEWPVEIWNLRNFTGDPETSGQMLINDTRFREEVCRKTILYVRAVFKEFRAILELPGFERVEARDDDPQICFR